MMEVIDNVNKTLKDKTIRYIKAKATILEYLESNDKITNAMIQELCGFSKQQARTVIDKMRKENLLELCKKALNPIILRNNGCKFYCEFF